MNHFDPAFLIAGVSNESKARTVRSKIRAWIASAPLTELIELYDGNVSLDGPLEEVLERLEAFSDRWDFRRIARERGAQTDDEQRQGQGSARWLSASTGLSRDLEARVFDAAGHLGLLHSQTPKQPHYNSIVALGGARLSCKLRPSFAAEVMHAGITAEWVALLGAARPIPVSERDATDTYAPGANDEFDLIVAGGQQAFGYDASVFDDERYDDPTNRNLSWVVRRFKATFAGQPLNVLAISAPSSDPLHRRANSADTILFLLDHENIKPGNSMLLITSQIYVPYVQLEALRTVALPRQILVETVGFPTERMPSLQGLTEANHYLQEIRSTIQAARRFCLACPE